MNDSSPTHFIRKIVEDDLAAGKHGGVIQTRFPPEPNGYLHIGHAKAICLNFGLARDFGGRCNLRFDDTNPEKENIEYMRAIERDVNWLGFEWDWICHASDYFEQLYNHAVTLIETGDAYVCSLSPEQVRAQRGTLTEPGIDSPDKERSIKDNLALFLQMRAGAYEENQYTLRARIDMRSPNINMRDPVIYRIRKATHHRTGDAWCIYPTYDFTHCLSDSIENITHSLCTLEFEDHRPLYDWFLERLHVHHPRQIEFARLQLKHTITSKRNLKKLVDRRIVDGYDDPRMPTLSGLRRRGIPPGAIRDFCARIGITKKDSWIEMDSFETCVRDYLDPRAPRALVVLRPLEVVIENYPEGKTEMLEASNHPGNPAMGARSVPFSRTLYIEREDFMEAPPKKFFRLAPGREVRLRYAYCITCRDVEKDAQGNPVRLVCTYDPQSRGGPPTSGRKVKSTIHWVSAAHAGKARVHLYDRLLTEEIPSVEDMLGQLNPGSLVTLENCRVEPSLGDAAPEQNWQFERLGYFCRDGAGEPLTFNRTLTLRDTWAKIKPTQTNATKRPSNP